MFDIDAASADIRKELYARDFSVQDFIARAERRRLSVTDARADAASNVLDQLASRLRIDPSWLIATAGCLLFVSLNAAAKDLTLFTFPSPEADVGVARILAVATFAAVQQLVGFELSSWLRLSGTSDGRASPLDPIFELGSPLAGVAFALLFFVPVAGLNALGLNLLPVYGTGFPSTVSSALLTFLIAPFSEEVFFRAWLLSAFERAGGSPHSAMIASAGLYGLYVVPLSSVLSGTTGGSGSALLLLYEALGGLLAFLFQRSGGSLPLVVVSHCTFNLAVALYTAAVVAPALSPAL